MPEDSTTQNRMSELAQNATNLFWGKIRKQPKDGFDTIWSLLALASVTSFLDSLFFNEVKAEGYSDPFFKNRNKLNDDNFVKLCKILIGQYLHIFLSNPGNTDLMTGIYQDTGDLVKRFFEQNIFTNFDFDDNDILLYRNLNEVFTIKLYTEIMTSINADDYKNPYAGLAFEEMSVKSYESFMRLLGNNLKDKLFRRRKT